MILEKGLSNILVVVTRYFGGILLGTGGLVRCYSGATEEALKKAEIIQKTMGYEAKINVDYSNLEALKYTLEKMNIKVLNIEYLENIEIIVFKGIIFRNMYNNPDDRMSSDEDILVKQEDYDRIKDILCSEGLEFIEKEGNECAYFCKKTGLCIEVSTSLFPVESKAYGHLNKVFENIFENSININIDGIDIKTLSHEQHLIYIVFHNMKHFLHGGFGIRQVADFSKYIETYNQFINWEKFWSDLKTLNYDTFALNLIDISLKYLGFDYTKAIYPEGVRDFNIIINSKDYYINSDDLINDILNAGVFGGSTKERKHTALMTLNAVEGQNNTNRFKAIFPNVDYLKGSYTYLQKHPILLPIAWTQRILSYLKKNKNNTTSYINTMELGKQRIELLKEYKIIK